MPGAIRYDQAQVMIADHIDSLQNQVGDLILRNRQLCRIIWCLDNGHAMDPSDLAVYAEVIRAQ